MCTYSTINPTPVDVIETQVCMTTKAYIAHANHSQGSRKRKSKWAASAEEPQARQVDDILTYLNDPVVLADAI